MENITDNLKDAENAAYVDDGDNIYIALARAQSSMGKIIKGSVNLHYKSKYADLSDVLSAVIPHLTVNGICLFHNSVKDGDLHYMRTVLMHGESGTSIYFDAPILTKGKNDDMQAYKSASTYAKRIGVESVTGVAPEDDDGNEAVKPAVKQEPSQPAPISKEKARPIYEKLQTAIRGYASADSLKKWWLSPECKADYNLLPDDWKKDLQNEFNETGIALRKQEEIFNAFKIEVMAIDTAQGILDLMRDEARLSKFSDDQYNEIQEILKNRKYDLTAQDEPNFGE